jgi:hypothetical protein
VMPRFYGYFGQRVCRTVFSPGQQIADGHG